MSDYTGFVSVLASYLEASAQLALSAAEELRQHQYEEELRQQKSEQEEAKAEADAPSKQRRAYSPRPGRRRPNSNRGRVRSWSTNQQAPFSTVDAAAALPHIPLQELRGHLAVLVKLRELQRLGRGMYAPV